MNKIEMPSRRRMEAFKEAVKERHPLLVDVGFFHGLLEAVR